MEIERRNLINALNTIFKVIVFFFSMVIHQLYHSNDNTSISNDYIIFI